MKRPSKDKGFNKQEATTNARLEQLEYEACERLGIQLRLQHLLEFSGELECQDTDTVRQPHTPNTSDNEEDFVTEEQDSSSTVKSELGSRLNLPI